MNKKSISCKIENSWQKSIQKMKMNDKLLNDICYEQIKDNFYYGKFGDFKLVIDKNTGCFNATKLCIDGGKEFRQWKRLERVQELIKFYERCRGISHGIFYEIRQANYNSGKSITGQYVQKEFILDIASWISPAFYFKCCQIINEYFVTQYKKELQDKNNELQEKNKEIQQKDDELQKQERFTNKLRDMVITMKARQKDQIIYIATTDAYAKQNRFKVGGVKSRAHLKSRLATYNSGRPVGDKMYYAYITETTDYHHLEQRISKILGDHKDAAEAEMFNVHYDSLQPLIEYLADRFDEEIQHHRKLFENLIKETIEKAPTVPEPIILNGAEFRRIKDGEVILTQKLDFDTMGNEAKKDFVSNLFEQFLVFNSTDLTRKDFEEFVAKSGTKFSKRNLWEVTKETAKNFNKSIKY